MQKISASETVEFTSGAVMTAHEYELHDPSVNIARITVSGRYPETGWAANEQVKELCYILEGTGTLYVGDASYPLAPGDVLLIEPGERFYWDANIVMLVPCTPAWTPEQYKHLDA